MPFVKLFMNIGLLSALLLSPAVLMLAFWYRKTFADAFMIWRRPEAIMLFVGYLVVALILIISGTACFFNYSKYSVIPENAAIAENFKDMALICFSFYVSATFFFLACRILLVQVITEKGILLNHRIFRIPVPNRIIYWEMLSDYYVHRDYPNVIFNLIYRTEGTNFQKTEIPVPSYLQENIKELLDSQLDGDNDLVLYRFMKHKRRG